MLRVTISRYVACNNFSLCGVSQFLVNNFKNLLVVLSRVFCQFLAIRYSGVGVVTCESNSTWF